MKAYIHVRQSAELMDGCVNFGPAQGLGNPTIYPSLSKAMAHWELFPEDFIVCEFEFTDPDEIIEAVNAATKGDSWETFRVKWLKFYSKKTA